MNCENVFNSLVSQVENYLLKNNLNTMVLGISGGIDSTVVSCICNEVSKRNKNLKFIGRSYPIKNKHDEMTSSNLVGKAFADNYKVILLRDCYQSLLYTIGCQEHDQFLINDPYEKLELDLQNYQTKIANGNIMARLRMINLYNLASITGGIVMDTDNKTEHELGFFTVHGDEGDLNPLSGLWKTDVYELARWLANEYYIHDSNKVNALCASIDLIPTDGNGISNSDLEQIGGKDYNEVDSILKAIISNDHQSLNKFDSEVVEKIKIRHERSQFKRLQRPLGLLY